MKSAEDIARELDLVYSQIGTPVEAGKPTASEDLLLLIGQALVAVVSELRDLNTKVDQVLVDRSWRDAWHGPPITSEPKGCISATCDEHVA